MSKSNVLEFVASELKGQIMTVSSLSAFVAAEKAADKLDMKETSRHAAQLSVLLPSVRRERICREFDSETADIFEALRRKRPNSKIIYAAFGVYKNSGNDKVRRDAAIATVAAEVAIASPDDSEYLAKLLGSMADQETDSEFSDFLKDLRGQLPNPSSAGSQEESHGQTTLISISMDICGSTEAKARMRTCAGDNKKQLTEWYEQFHHQFLLSEWDFYSQLFRNGYSGLALDWKHAFVVKGMGDEIWLLYEVSEVDQWKLKSLAARLFHAALSVAAKPIRWTSASDDDPCRQPFETRHLPLKFYMDILDDTYEVSGKRCDFVTKYIPEILGTEVILNNGDFIKLGNRLHAGSLMGDGRRLIQMIRTDYIGWEVDRFFRATKFALPMVATIGQNLFEKVFNDPKKSGKCLIGTGLQKAVIKCPIDQGRSARYDYDFRYVKKDIAPKKLKGVGEGYTVYWVLRSNELLGLHHTYADKNIMRKTLDVFTKEMVDAERLGL